MTDSRVRVAIADDHPALRIGIAHELAAANAFTVIGTASDSGELIALLDANGCDVVIADYAMPGGSFGDGASMLSYLKRRYDQINIVLYTMMENPGLLQNVIALGVECIVSKVDPTRHLSLAVSAASEGRRYLSPHITTLLHQVNVGDPATLTQRESEVLRLFVSGFTVNEIATRLNRSKKTVSAQKMAAMRKLGIEREADLYQYAATCGLLGAEQPPLT